MHLFYFKLLCIFNNGVGGFSLSFEGQILDTHSEEISFSYFRDLEVKYVFFA